MRTKIVETDLDFQYGLTERDETDLIVIHHTGGADIDADAETIHEWHINNDWAGIGYHFVIRKDGSVERGRPEWAIGSHAYGENSHSIGIHLSGEFDDAEPTDAQIEACACLIADLCEEYDIPIDRDHIVGHGELMSTDCPGANLQALLDDETLIHKAAEYAGEEGTDENNGDGDDGDDGHADVDDIDVEKIAVLSRKYESNGDPACVSSGAGDLGGVSYGLYQFASNTGAVDEFVAWLCDYPDSAYANYGNVLAVHNAGGASFDEQWRELGTIDPEGFGKLQDEYVKAMYYDRAAAMLAKKYYHVEKHSVAMRAVIMSRAIQHGPTGCVELMEYALTTKWKGMNWNLSYIDDKYFDASLIVAIYDALIRECDCAAPDNSGVWRSPEGFCNGSKSVIYGLRSRFIREKEDALALLNEEGKA